MDTAGDGAGDRAQKMAARWFPSVTWAAGPASLCWGEIWQTWPPAQQLPLPDPASMPCLRSLLNNSCFECIQAVGLISAIRWHFWLSQYLSQSSKTHHIYAFLEEKIPIAVLGWEKAPFPVVLLNSRSQSQKIHLNLQGVFYTMDESLQMYW